MERRSTDFSLLSVARCPQRVRRACRLINIGHDKYPTIDASALLGTGSISIRSSLREFVILDRRAKYFFLPSFLPSSSVVVADSGLDSWARFDSRRERERTRQRKRKNRGGREGKKKKKKTMYVYTQHSRLIFQQPLRCCTVSRYITRKTLRMIERGTRIGEERDSCVKKRSRTAYRRAKLSDLCC